MQLGSGRRELPHQLRQWLQPPAAGRPTCTMPHAPGTARPGAAGSRVPGRAELPPPVVYAVSGVSAVAPRWLVSVLMSVGSLLAVLLSVAM